MTIEIISMPKLGESVTEGTISKWLVAPGDKVSKYDPIAEVITDKVNAEIPSSYSGIIQELVAEEDQTLAIGDVICTIAVSGQSGNVQSQSAEKTETVQKAEVASNQSQTARYSPAVLRLSQQYGIDLTKVRGTGAGGRITRKDLMKVIEHGLPIEQTPPSLVPTNSFETQWKANTPQQNSVISVQGDIERPITPLRKTIAQNMVRSKQQIPHAWMMVEVDATNLVSLRDKEKHAFQSKEGFKLTYFAFFVKAVAQALKEFPQLNSTWAEDKIIHKKDIHLNIAVATEDSLFVPVIKHADEKSIKGIARDIAELAKKVRDGKLQAEDMQGGTFTVNNTGSFGSVQSSGIINYPQAAILQIESVIKRPVIINNMIAVRDMVNMCLSLDHRVLDGFICGKFLTRVKEIVENMSIETTSIY